MPVTRENLAYETRNPARSPRMVPEPVRRELERPRVVPKPQPSPKPSPAHKPNKQAKIGTWQALKILFISALMVMGVGLLIYSRIQLTETNSRINAATNELKAAQSEHTRMSMELDSKVALSRVEQYACNVLGMIKREKFQIEYIDVAQGGSIANHESGFEDAGQSLNERLKEIMEYQQ